jgi:hypothetical protein
VAPHPSIVSTHYEIPAAFSYSYGDDSGQFAAGTVAAEDLSPAQAAYFENYAVPAGLAHLKDEANDNAAKAKKAAEAAAKAEAEANETTSEEQSK